MWSFGNNAYGQLGIGNTICYKIPQKIQNFLPVQTISCGSNHTMFLTKDENLWSCGANENGQLCLGNQEIVNTAGSSLFKKQILGETNKWISKPTKTSFSNIAQICAGNNHSLFQNKKREIYACGYNENGELGLGHNKSPQIEVILIPNQRPNIKQFCCGSYHSLFLDSEGNVFYAGKNSPQVNSSLLGTPEGIKQNESLQQIPNSPPIQTISCVGSSSYLLDFEGYVWSFGDNKYGQLGHGDKINRNVPTKITTLQNIKQISYGCCGSHFLAKDSLNKIFVTGNNHFGQFGNGNSVSTSIPIETIPENFTTWTNVPYHENITNQEENKLQLDAQNSQSQLKAEMSNLVPILT